MIDVLADYGLLVKKLVPGQANRYAPKLDKFIELTRNITFKYREQAKDKKLQREHGEDFIRERAYDPLINKYTEVVKDKESKPRLF